MNDKSAYRIFISKETIRLLRLKAAEMGVREGKSMSWTELARQTLDRLAREQTEELATR